MRFLALLFLAQTGFCNTEVEDLGEGRLRIGQVELDQKTRIISFPAVVNMDEGLLEFAVVHENGKLHESLFSTTTSAMNINIALKLLNYQESPELFPILNEDYESTGEFPEVAPDIRAAARIRFSASWNQNNTNQEVALNELIYHLVLEKPMPPGPWLIQGSYLHNGTFKAETSGDLCAIFISRSALFNYPGDGHGNDEIWIPNPNKVPPIGTPVTLSIQPYESNKPTADL